MTSRLSDKKSKVIVVDPSGPVRQMMADVVRTGLGFEVVESRPSVAELLAQLEVDPNQSWVIMPLLADQPVNGMHLLKLISMTPELKHVRVSMCLEDSETYLLPAAYELGLLSNHGRPFTKDGLTEELRRVMSNLEANGFKEPLTAGHYLRTHLRATKQHARQLELEKGLLDLYPGDPNVLLNLAEPQALSGKKTEAHKVLCQVKLVQPNLGDRVDELAKQLLGADAPKITGTAADLGGDGANILGVSSCVIIDSDETNGKAVQDTLAALGVQDIKYFADGESAWAAMEKAPEPGLVLMEWRIPRLSGPLLVQRIRSHGFLNVPIVVHSSLLKPEDMPLVREMGIASIITKPLNKELFVPSIIWVMQQDRLPTENQALERKFRAMVNSGKKAEAEPLRAQILGNPAVPLAKKRLIEAEWAFLNANYPLARDAAVESLKIAGDNIVTLNLLGKTFMCLRSHAAALKCFKKAQDLSPQNVERLCQIAEVQTELGNAEAAGENIDAAKALDPDSKTVTEAQVKVAITAGDTNAAKKIMGDIESLSSLVAYMNNKAVAHAKCGFTTEAIELYRKTTESIPDDREEARTIVRYNLALAQAKAGDLEDAVKELAEVIKVKDSKVVKKAQSLHERLVAAMKTGKELKLKGEIQEQAKATQDAANEPTSQLSSDEEHMALLAQVEARRGDVCCYLVFNDPSERDIRVGSLLAKMPRFQRREAIEREESGGADQLAKSS